MAHIRFLKLNLNKQSAFYLVLFRFVYMCTILIHVGKQQIGEKQDSYIYILFCKCVFLIVKVVYT